MEHGYLVYGLASGLAIALLAAAFTDIRRRQIDNGLNAAIALAAPLFWWATGLSLWPGMALQFGMAFLAFGALTALFAFKLMGGGDVKLLTALALWLPWNSFLQLLLIMSLVGGILTILFGAVHVMRRRKGQLKIPYGVAIACAGIAVLAMHYNPLAAPTVPSIG